MPHRLRTPPRIWAPKASLRGSYTRFIDFSDLQTTILVVARVQDRPPVPRPPRRAPPARIGAALHTVTQLNRLVLELAENGK